MLTQRPDFALAIAKLLPPERAQGLPAVVDRADRRGKVDFPARLTNAIVEFIILIDDEAFIKQADAVEQGAMPRAQIHRVQTLYAAKLQDRRYRYTAASG